MTELISIFIAAFFNNILRLLSSADYWIGSLKGFSSFIILLSICFHIRNTNFFPDRYRETSEFIYTLIEILISSTIMEFIDIAWQRLQILIEVLAKFLFMDNDANLYKESGGDALLGLIIISIAAAFLIYSISITKHTEALSVFVTQMIDKIKHYSSEEIIVNGNNSTNYCTACPCEPQTDRKKLRKSISIKPASH